MLYTNDKNVNKSIKIPEALDYTTILGEQYLQEIKWFFKNLYCIDSFFREFYYSSIATYLVYLSILLECE